MSRPSPSDSIIEIKQEVKHEALAPPFDIENVKIHFISSQNAMDRELSFKACPSIARLFRAADGSNIINNEIDKLTVTVNGTEDSAEMNVMRDFEEDFDELKEKITRMEARVINVTRGTSRLV